MKASRTLISLLFAALLWGCDTDGRDWRGAAESDTRAAYAAYLESHPEGQHVAEARVRIRSFEAADAWQSTSAADTLDAYRTYVERFGDTTEASTARERIANLERAAAWETARRDGSEAVLADFVQRYPDTDEANQARAMLEDIEAERRRAEAEAKAEAERLAREEAERAAREAAARATSRIQLASFWTRESAIEESQRLQILLGDRLSTPLVVQAPEEHGSSRYFRVVTEPLEPGAARSECESIQQAGHECFVVGR